MKSREIKILSLFIILAALIALGEPIKTYAAKMESEFMSPEEVQDSSDLILGNWQFYKIHYQDKDMPPLNPNLVIQFEFYPDGTSRLFWMRRNEPGICERRAYFEYADNLLNEEVFWTNPENDRECESDPDMRKGTVRTTRMELKNEELYLYLELKGEDFIYIWKRIR